MEFFPTIILLATDGSEEAWIASRMAAGIAEGTGSELHLVYLAGTGGVDPRVYEQMRRSSRAFLDEQAHKMRDAGRRSRESTCATGGRTGRSWRWPKS